MANIVEDLIEKLGEDEGTKQFLGCVVDFVLCFNSSGVCLKDFK